MSHTLITAAFFALVLLQIYRYGRRSVSRQKVGPSLVLRAAIFAVIGVLLLATDAALPVPLASGLAGVLAGAGLAWYGLRHTRFERFENVSYFTPSRYIGLGVLAVFLVRTAIELAPIASHLATGSAGPMVQSGYLEHLAHNPVTAGTALLLFSYFALYWSAVMLAGSSGRLQWKSQRRDNLP